MLGETESHPVCCFVSDASLVRVWAWQAQGVGGLLGPVSGDLQVITVERGPSVRERVTPVLRWGARHHRIAAQCSDSRPIKYIISFSIDDSHYSEDSLFLDALAIICTSYIRTT